MGKIIISVFIILMMVQPGFADEAALAKESAAYAQSTAPTRPTPPQLIIDKLNEACTLLAAEGSAAYSKFKGQGSKYLFEGTYVWIHQLSDAKMVMHPIKNKLVGKKLIGLKDKTGKRFFTVMNRLVAEKGSGWVSYLWPKPGTKDFVKKVSYVKKCVTADNIEVVLGCGLYNYSEEDLKNLEIN